MWDVLRQLWTFVAVSLLVYQGGLASKALATRFDLRAATGQKPTAWDIWMRLAPLVVGALFGFLPLPTLDAIDAITVPTTLVLCRCGWFMLAGALCGQVYEAIRFIVDWGKQHFSGATAKTAIAPEVAAEAGDPSAGEMGNAP